MKRKIYSPALLSKYKAYFTNNHSKFVHGHPTRLEDLNREMELEGKQVILIGQSDDEPNVGVLSEPSTGFIYVAPLALIKLTIEAKLLINVCS